MIRNNDRGLVLSGSVYSVVHDNNFLDNGVQAQISGSEPSIPNSWNMSYALGGNYWSNYNGSDKMRGEHQNLLGADGIGDMPYSIGESNVDNYPHKVPSSSDASPSAKFSFEPLTPVVRHDSVVFRDESFDLDGSVIFRVWSFGDGDFSFDVNSSKMYMSPSVFRVVLFVVDDCGNSAAVETKISVRKVASRVDFSIPTKVLADQQVNFSVIAKDEFNNSLKAASLRIFINSSGVEEFSRYYTTNESGVAAVSQTFNKSGIFSLRVVFDGDDILNGCEVSCTVLVEYHCDYLFLPLILLSILAGAYLVLGLLRKRKVQKDLSALVA
jgi:hypothetical protein